MRDDSLSAGGSTMSSMSDDSAVLSDVASSDEDTMIESSSEDTISETMSDFVYDAELSSSSLSSNEQLARKEDAMNAIRNEAAARIWTEPLPDGWLLSAPKDDHCRRSMRLPGLEQPAQTTSMSVSLSRTTDKNDFKNFSKNYVSKLFCKREKRTHSWQI
jgi:hypothetical protein